MARLEKQVVLITGCSSGIGRALALEFHARGHRVFATARKLTSLTELETAGMEIRQLDVTNSQSIRSAVNSVVQETGRLDIVVNNAGILVVGPLAEIPIDDFRAEFETNVTGALAVVQAAVVHMHRQGGGRIVNVGSVSAELATPFSGAYCASKAALHTLTDVLRIELEPFGIETILVAPGAVKSSIDTGARRYAEKYRSAESIYHPVSKQIERRAGASQERPMTAEAFARRFVQMVTAAKAPRMVRIGREAWIFPVVKAGLPAGTRDRLLSRAFGLGKLKGQVPRR